MMQPSNVVHLSIHPSCLPRHFSQMRFQSFTRSCGSGSPGVLLVRLYVCLNQDATLNGKIFARSSSLPLEFEAEPSIWAMQVHGRCQGGDEPGLELLEHLNREYTKYMCTIDRSVRTGRLALFLLPPDPWMSVYLHMYVGGYILGMSTGSVPTVPVDPLPPGQLASL